MTGLITGVLMAMTVYGIVVWFMNINNKD